MKDAWDDDDDDDWENAELALPAAPAPAAAAAAGSDSEEETEEDRRRAKAAETHKGAAGGPRQVKAGTLEAKIQAREASSASSQPDVADINFGPDDDGPRGELDLSVGTREALAFYHDEAEGDADAASGLTDAQRRARKKASVERADAKRNAKEFIKKGGRGMAPVVATPDAPHSLDASSSTAVSNQVGSLYREEDVGDEPNEKKMVRAAKKQFDAMKLEEGGRKGKG